MASRETELAGLPPGSDAPGSRLSALLDQLIGPFRRGTPPDAAYTFKHALVQDVAYGTLSRSQRHLLHARIAQTLENQFPDTVAAQPALLARHCEQADLIGKAISYRRKASQLAIARSTITS